MNLKTMAQSIVAVVSVVLSIIALSPIQAATKPNIVFFLIDDLGYADVGFNGGKVIQTPHIDRLASRGAVLESHYVQPVCSPTRAALMTGRYATHTGVYTIVRPHAKWGMPLSERTLANALRDAGYETAITGKWHLGEFDRRTFPHLAASIISMDITSVPWITSRTFAMTPMTGIATIANLRSKAIRLISSLAKLRDWFARNGPKAPCSCMYHSMECTRRSSPR